MPADGEAVPLDDRPMFAMFAREEADDAVPRGWWIRVDPLASGARLGQVRGRMWARRFAGSGEAR
jgi:hypothetical protein